MRAHLELRGPGGPDLVALTDDRVTIGRSPGNSVVLDADRRVSGLHAVIERLGAGWCVRDLGSTNGTTVGGERVTGERALRAGDELLIGQTRVTFRAERVPADHTEAAEPAPEMTRRERDVVIALCRPLFAGAAFVEPASMREIAAELVVSEAAVQQHLLRLYQKFDLYEDGGRRRVRLANEAVRRGAVSDADLRTAR